MGCRLWGCTESDTTEATQQQQQHELSNAYVALPTNKAKKNVQLYTVSQGAFITSDGNNIL